MWLAFVFCHCRKNTWFPISWLNTIQMDYLTASLGPELSMAGWGSPPRVSNGKNQVLARAAVSSGHAGIFQAHSGCWQSLVPNDTGNEVPSSCWLSTGGLLEAIHHSLPHDSKTWQRPHHGQQEYVSAALNLWFPQSLTSRPRFKGLVWWGQGCSDNLPLINPKSTPSNISYTFKSPFAI